MTMITPSYLGETIEYSSLHACRSTLEDPTGLAARPPVRSLAGSPGGLETETHALMEDDVSAHAWVQAALLRTEAGIRVT